MFLSPGSRAKARLASLWKAAGANIYYLGGFVGIGTTTPTNQLTLSFDQSPTIIGLYSYATGSNLQFPSLIGRRARGSLAAPTAVQTDDRLLRIGGGGYGATAFSNANRSNIDFLAAEAWSDTAQGAYFRFLITAAGGTASSQGLRVGPGVVVGTGTTDPGAGNLLVGNFINSGGFVRVSSQFDKTTDAALANIPGLSVTVIAGSSYFFRAVLFTTSGAGGCQVTVNGTATATAVRYETVFIDANAVIFQSRKTALGSAAGVSALTAAKFEIEGLITVNAGGTLTIQFAQNASNGATSSVLVGSFLEVKQIT